jgi:hypothetical protein
MSAVPVMQLVLAVVACVGLYRVCRAQPKIVIAGFLVRAVTAQALFWISYLRLPILPSLQLGDGFWFFAADGPEYLLLANRLAERGVMGIFTFDGPMPSHLFVRLLAILVIALGGVASLAILVNCAAYALTCALLVRMKQNDVLLAAIAFSPAAILFSLQLLKDTLFFLLIVLMVAIFRRWQELWWHGGARGQFLACAAAMPAIVSALAGIRWYFAAIVWGASAIFFGLVSWRARRRASAVAVSAILFVLLAQSVRVGSHDMPPQIARMLSPGTVFQSRPDAVPKLVERARRGFDTTPAATTVAPGPRIASSSAPKVDSSSAPLPQTIPVRLITGFSATFLPRFVAQPLGLIRVGGGRGFWLFADLDTIVFASVLLYVVFRCARILREGAAHMTPLFVMLSLVLVLTGGLMVYTVNNFGTLFRLRQMLYALAVVIPVTLRKPEDEENGAGRPFEPRGGQRSSTLSVSDS